VVTGTGPGIRVACLGGSYIQPGAQRFFVMLDDHPEVDLVAILCQGPGGRWLDRWADLFRRRGWLAPLVWLLEAGSMTAEFLRSPAEALRLHQKWRRLRRKVEWFPDLHAPRAVSRLRDFAPDLAVIYGGPLLREQVFSLPRLGTLGIHHGRVPAYRGRKTTFWEMYYGESHAGITIQQVGAGIDTGDVVGASEVAIGARSYGSVWREVERVGCELFLQAVLEAHRGSLTRRPHDGLLQKGKVFRQPTPWQLLTLRLHRRRILQQKAVQ